MAFMCTLFIRIKYAQSWRLECVSYGKKGAERKQTSRFLLLFLPNPAFIMDIIET